MTAKEIFEYLVGFGFTEEGTAGLMGNLKAESNFNSKNLQNSFQNRLGFSDEEYTRAVDSGSYNNFVHDSAGYGLAQWTYWNRKQNLLNYARNKGASIGDCKMQLDFLCHELKGYKAVYEVLKTTKSVKEASDIVLLQFERPADQSESVKNKRASYGQEIFNLYANKRGNEVESGTSANTSVLEWQKAAIADGFKFPKYGADGVWGAECEAIARNAIVKKRLIYQYKNLTKIVQKAVGVAVDGKCGKDTKAAIIRYQAAHGLEQDGCVGLNTWKKILGVR